MPVMDWKKGFETGIPDVDIQHKLFVALINRLHDEVAETDNQNRQVRLLDELKSYARFHFISEENIFIKIHPDRFKKHKGLHDELLKELERRVEQIIMGQTSAKDVLQFVIEWFTNHTTTEDALDFI